MIKIKEVGFICYPSKDIDRSRAFYEGVLGLKGPDVSTEGGTWVEYDLGPSAAFSIGKMDGFEPTRQGGQVAFEVDDFDAAIEAIRTANVQFYMEPIETSACRMASIADPDGNTVLIHKRNA